MSICGWLLLFVVRLAPLALEAVAAWLIHVDSHELGLKTVSLLAVQLGQNFMFFFSLFVTSDFSFFFHKQKNRGWQQANAKQNVHSPYLVLSTFFMSISTLNCQIQAKMQKCKKNNRTRTSHSQFAPSGALPYNNQTALCLYLKMLIKKLPLLQPLWCLVFPSCQCWTVKHQAHLQVLCQS